ncbi:hypothetical protein BAOM_3005 [Peribacillus asahii]|uniref:HTH cro/C1-type domain-containing protein n=1 Tax=Peribacillus asahii TaxID=228899 RepID=A0A3Q9RNB6_9BACI|nr:helix-turn-helix transcriptional regulator [Peribacillus asahii]AZV43614.1 hypothetical protein BAOM_3005 [Peribacillus asahii]
MKRNYVMQITHEEMAEYGKLFRSLRKSTGLSLTKFADELKIISRTSLSKWEKGISVPKEDIYLIECRIREVAENYNK